MILQVLMVDIRMNLNVKCTDANFKSIFTSILYISPCRFRNINLYCLENESWSFIYSKFALLFNQNHERTKNVRNKKILRYFWTDRRVKENNEKGKSVG